MNPRSTGMLFLVAVVVVAGVFWNENVRKGQAEQAEADARALFPGLAADGLTFIALETTDGQEVRLERPDGAWRGVAPLSFPTDGTAVEGLVAALVESRSEGVIESPQEPGVYGLADDATVVRFGTADGEFELRVGGKTPVGGNTYAARADSDAVYTIPSFRASAVRRSLLDLREKRALRFDPAAIETVELAWPGERVVLEKGEAGWKLREPIADDADPATVDALLQDLSFLRAEGFIDAPPPDPEVGLDRPAFEAKLTAPGDGGEVGPQVFHLKVGRELEDGAHRAARGREHSLYRIPSERLADFPRRVAAYRWKQLARFTPGDAAELEIAFHDPEAGAHVVLAERTEDGWASTPESMAAGRAARMVAELSTLNGDDILAEAMGPEELAALGLAPPRVRFRVKAAAEGDAPGAVLAEVWLGEPDPDRGIVARAGDRERVYRIDYALAEHLPISVEAFRNRFLSQEEPGDDPSPTP
ncbi:MAG: DUF4340 domain-containing protein [Myxococcales bacterium]|nr:DUF4340 domain-containing protein [Myxococcales bacterium]